MFNLLSNENMKIYRRLRTWIMVALILVGVILVAWVLHVHQHVDPNWKQSLMDTNASAQKELTQPHGHIPAAEIASMKQQIALNSYYIAHNINPNLTTGFKFATTAVNLSTLVIAFILVVAGDIVASEFSTGTIKMLLTQTATRTKILVSKYIAAIIYGLFMLFALLVFSYVVGGIFFGFGGGGQSHIYVDAHLKVRTMTTAAYWLMQYGFLVIQMIMTVTIAFMISAIFRSSALAITISLLAFVVGSTIVGALSSFSWVKYILFANTNLTQYVVGGPSIHGMTLDFSITMLIAYFVVMSLLSWIVFVKRDVAYT